MKSVITILILVGITVCIYFGIRSHPVPERGTQIAHIAKHDTNSKPSLSVEPDLIPKASSELNDDSKLSEDETQERAVIAELKSLKKWPAHEKVLIRTFTLKFADFIAHLNLPDNEKEEVFRLLVESYMPTHTTSEVIKIDAEIRKALGSEDNCQALLQYKSNMRQNSIDDTIGKAYIAARPDAAIDEVTKVGQIISQIQVSKDIHAIFNESANVSDTQINEFVSKMNASLESAVATSNLDAQAQVVLKNIVHENFINEFQQALQWQKAHQKP